MSDGQLRYPQPQRYPAVLTDRWGRCETTLVNDGQSFEMVVRGHRFAGSSLDGLELVASPIGAGQVPDVHHGELCSCTIEWTMPVRVALCEGETIEANLHARLTLGDPASNNALDHEAVTLALDLPNSIVQTARPHGWMEDALLDLLHALPQGVRLVACISCAFSDYHPAGSGFIGTMACFRDAQDAYRAVDSKIALFHVWDQRTGFVQETFCCPQFVQRQPGAGYRGWPSSLVSPPAGV